MATTAKKRKEKKSVYEGNVYIQATFNNTIITITDLKGNALSWASSGGLGFNGAKNPPPLLHKQSRKRLYSAFSSMGCGKFMYL